MTNYPNLLKKNPRIGSRYTLQQLIATGAKGAVFRASRDGDGVEVAVKVLLSRDTEGFEEEKRHFLAGSTLSMDLEHPNLVQTIDCGEDLTWGPFQVMELLTGASLSSRLKAKETLPESSIMAIGAQLALVIDYIHGMGMLHGDIKPENLFLCRQGEAFTVKLMDFLPKRRLKDWMDLDLTPEYLAPEIFAGRQPGPALDHFALGVLLFEITFGKLPSFRNNGSLALPREHGVSEDLIKILRGLLSFKPERRAETLSQLLTRQPPEEVPPELGRETTDPHGKHAMTASQGSSFLDRLRLAMLDSDPFPRLLLSRTGRILYRNTTAAALLGDDREWDYFARCPLAFSAPVLLSDIQDALETVKVTSRRIELGDAVATCWTVPIVTEGEVSAVQIVLSPTAPIF